MTLESRLIRVLSDAHGPNPFAYSISAERVMKAVFQIAKKPTDGRAFILLMSGPEMIGRCFWVNNPRRIAYPDGQKVVVGVLREGNKVYVCIRRAPNGRRTGLGNRDWMIRDNPSGFAQRNIVRSQATVDGLVLDLIQWTTETE